MNMIMASEVYNQIFYRRDINEIVDICMAFLSNWREGFNEPYSKVADRIVKIGDKENFCLQLEQGVAKKIVDAIYLHKGAEEIEKRYVKERCYREGISVYEIDFNQCGSMKI